MITTTKIYFRVFSLLAFFLLGGGSSIVFGQTVTPGIGGVGISADNFATGTWTTINDILIQETSPGQLQPGQIRLQAPTGFIWDIAGTDPVVTVTQPKGARVTVTLASRTVSEIIFDVVGNSGGTPPNNPHAVEIDNIRLRPAQGSPLLSGQIRNAGSSAPGGTLNYGTVSMVAGADSRTRVENAPNSGGSVVSAQDVTAGTSITVYSNVRDQFNNFKRNETGTTWSLQNITGSIVAGDLVASGGSATFTGDLVGTANIQASFGALTNVQSGLISVVPANATTLFLNTEPSSMDSAGIAFATQPVVFVQDDFGNITTDDSFTQVTVVRNTGEGILQGTTTKTAVNGVITFTNLNHLVANDIDLEFSATGFQSINSQTITIIPAEASNLKFVTQPTNANRNNPVSPAVTVQITDTFDNNVPQAGTLITLTLASGTGNVSNGTASTDVNGLATFPTLSFNQIGAKIIVASATGLANTPNSNQFTVANAGELAGFEVEISGGGNIGSQTAGSNFNIRIRAVDGVGSLLDGNMGRNNFSGFVDLTTNSTFSSSTTITNVGPFVNGVFDPHSVNLELAGNDIFIAATNSGGTESGSSNLFSVLPAAANADSSFFSASADSLIADGVSIADITIQLRDVYGNNLITGGDTVTLSRTGTGTLSAVTDNNDGTYSATITAPNGVGSAVISAQLNSVSITSGNISIVYTYGDLATFLVENFGGGAIGSQVAGTAFNIRLTAQDNFNNTIEDFNGTAEITSSGILSSGSGTTAAFTNGILSSHSVTLTSVGSTTLSARRTAGSETGTSTTFTINPGAASTATSLITSARSFLQSNNTDNTVITVQLKDQFGNNLIDGSNTVALSSTAGTLSALTNNNDGTYTATLTAGNVSATATVTGTLNSFAITDNAVVVITQFNEWTANAGGNPGNRVLWENAGNWSVGIPTTGQVIVIPTGLDRYPIIGATDPIIDFLSIETGANVSLSGRTLTINNEISGDGSFAGNSGIINLLGDALISNFIAGSSVINFSGTTLQSVSGDFTGNTINIQNDVSVAEYFEAFTNLNVAVGNTLTMASGSQLVVFGDITIDGSLVGNDSRFNFRGNINGSNITLNGTDITLDGANPQVINGISNIKSFTIDNTAGVTVNNDLTVTDTLFITNGELIISSGFSFVSNVKSGLTENIRMLREISGNAGWRLITAPLETTFGDFLDGTITQGYTGAFYSTGSAPGDTLQPNVLFYDETAEGTDNQRFRAPASAATDVSAGKGYFVYFFGDIPADTRYNEALPDTLSLSGAENEGNGTEFIFPVTYTASGDTGWNLVGNPYTATVDWDDGNWTKTNMDNVIYVWDNATNDYLTWNGTTGSLGDGKIAPFQAFWVKANGNGAPNLRVNKASKTTAGTFFKQQRREKAIIAFDLESKGLQKSTHVSFQPGGSNGKDCLDAYRLLPFDTSTFLELYTLFGDGTQLAINNLPRDFGVPIQIPIYVGGYDNGVPIEGEFTLRWQDFDEVPESWTLILVDQETGESYNLREEESITFEHSTNPRRKAKTASSSSSITHKDKSLVNEARFMLEIEPGADADGIPDEFRLFNNYPNPFNASTNFRFTLPLEGFLELSIYDILGRKVSTLVSENLQAGLYNVRWDADAYASGVYIAVLQTSKQRFIQKLTLLK